MGHTAVISTGGTIAELHTDVGEGRHLPARDLLAHFDAFSASSVDIECIDVCGMNSSDLGTLELLALSRAVLERVAAPDCSGIVLTTGTNTLEEVATFLSALSTEMGGFKTPTIVTGAMRTASDDCSDGGSNLRSALRTATHPAATGVTVCFAGRLHAGWNVVKAQPARLDPFVSISDRWPAVHKPQLNSARRDPRAMDLFSAPPSLSSDHLVIERRTTRYEVLLEALSGQVPTVPIVPTYLGVEANQLELVAADCDALVLETLGDGQVPVSVISALARSVRPVPVVLASQGHIECGGWNTRDESDSPVWSSANLTVSSVRAPARHVRMVALLDTLLRTYRGSG